MFGIYRASLLVVCCLLLLLRLLCDGCYLSVVVVADGCWSALFVAVCGVVRC